MRFHIGTKELSEAIGLAGNAVAVKGIKPILANLLVVANEQNIRFVGTDLEIMFIANVPAQVESEGYFTIPAKLLQDVISSMPTALEGTNLVTFEFEADESEGMPPSQVRISSGRNNFFLQIQGIEDFPPVPVLENEGIPTFTLKTKNFGKSIKEAAIAMSSEDGNPVQRGLCLDFNDEQRPVVIATDSKRLAVTAVEDFQVPEEFRQTFIVPSRAIGELQKLVDANEEIQLSLYKEQLVFNAGNFILISRLVNGRFPDHNRVVPKDPSRKLKIKRKDFTQALKSVMPIARNNDGLVNMEISQNETRIWSFSKEQGSVEFFVSSELEGDAIHIAFNLKYLQDFLGVIIDEEVLLEMTTPMYPGLFKPGNPESSYQYVVMPMTVVDMKSQEN